MLKAALSHFVALRDRTVANLNAYLQNPVGVGEHPQITEEAAKLVEQIVESTEKVKYCQNLYYREGEDEVVDTSDLEVTVQNLVNKMNDFMNALGGKSEGEE